MNHYRDYHEAHAYAIKLARDLGREMGLEKASSLYYGKDPGFNVIHLPKPENRFGHELRCQVVSPNDPLSDRDVAALERLGLTCKLLTAKV